MRFLVLIKANNESEAGVLPDEEFVAEMGKYNQALVDAGVMLAAEGLHPSARAVRVRFTGDDIIVTDGPFTETKELIAGFWLWKCDSIQEAVGWVKRCPKPKDAGEGVIEIRPIFETDDFLKNYSPELSELQEQIRTQIDQQS